MFVSILFGVRKSAQADAIISGFRASGILIRDLEIRLDGRSFYLIYKTDDIAKTRDFVVKAAATYEGVKENHIEFLYDDGQEHFYNVSDGTLIQQEDRYYTNTGSWISIEQLTGIKGNLDKAVRAWAKEIGASTEETRQKLDSLKESKRAWDERMDQDIERTKRRNERSATPKGVTPSPEGGADTEWLSTPAGGGALTIDGIAQTIARINVSGRAYIPFVVFPADLSPALPRKEFLALVRRFDVSAARSGVHQSLAAALDSTLAGKA